MKKLVLITTFFFSMVGHAEYSTASDFRGEGFVEIVQNTEEKQNYESGKKLAIKLLNQAYEQLSEKGQSYATQIVSRLQTTKILVSTNQESESICTFRKAGLFVNSNFLDTIFVCNSIRKHVNIIANNVINILAQNFIHEGVHLINNFDECTATLYERTVMSYTIGVQTNANYNHYYERCKDKWPSSLR